MSNPNLTVEHIGEKVAQRQLNAVEKNYAAKYASLTNAQKHELKKKQDANAIQAAVKQEKWFGIFGGKSRKQRKHRSKSRKQRKQRSKSRKQRK